MSDAKDDLGTVEVYIGGRGPRNPKGVRRLVTCRLLAVNSKTIVVELPARTPGGQGKAITRKVDRDVPGWREGWGRGQQAYRKEER